jgi:hypothetical protein
LSRHRRRAQLPRSKGWRADLKSMYKREPAMRPSLPRPLTLTIPTITKIPSIPRLALLAALAVSACGSPPPPPPAAPPPPPPPAEKAPEEEQASTQSEIGGMNEEATNRAFDSLGPAIQECISAGSGRVKALGGTVTIALRVARDGAAKWAYMKSSTLGDRETERCMLDAVRSKAWPKPVGGDGLAEKSFDLEPLAKPVEVDEEKQKRPIALVRKEAWKCRKGVRGSFVATVYIRTNGKVLTAGVTPPNEKGEGAADCMAELIGKVKFAPPGRRTGKLSFEL